MIRFYFSLNPRLYQPKAGPRKACQCCSKQSSINKCFPFFSEHDVTRYHKLLSRQEGKDEEGKLSTL